MVRIPDVGHRACAPCHNRTVTVLELVRVVLPGGGPEIEFSAIPAGAFLMGDVLNRSPERDTRPVHEVFVDAFAIARTTVTNEQFAWFVRQTGYRTTREHAGYPQTWTRYALVGRERYPVICINWIDAGRAQ